LSNGFLADLLEHRRGQVFSFEQQAKLRLIERRVVEQREEHVAGVMVKERSEFSTGCCSRAIAVLIQLGHVRTPVGSAWEKNKRLRSKIPQ